MNLTSFFTNKLFEYLLDCDNDREAEKTCDPRRKSVQPRSSILPPWSLAPDDFKALCDGCGDCVAACAENVLILGEDGLPAVDFSDNFCTFCGECARLCPTGALHCEPEHPPWNLSVSINENCLINKNVLCQICVEQCDKEAIILPRTMQDEESPEITAEKCDGCGACYGTCPANAIVFKKKNEQRSNIDQTLEK
jgi:ferredoxin-type protein NapF